MPPSGGGGHVTVTVIALFPTVQYHLSNMCPEEEPLSSFGFAPPPPLLSNGDQQHTNRPGYSAACSLWWYGGSSNLRVCLVGSGTAWRAPPVVTGSARSTWRHRDTGDTRNTCGRYSLLAGSLPRWYLPEGSRAGGRCSRGRRGAGVVEGGYASASPPARQPASPPAKLPASTAASAQRHRQRQCDPRFPVSVPKIYLTLSISHPAARPFLLLLSSPKPVTASKPVSASVAASNPRSLFANTLRKSSSTPVIRFVYLFSFRDLCDPPPDPSQNPRLFDPAWQHFLLAAVPAILNSTPASRGSLYPLQRLVHRRSRLSPTDHHISVNPTQHCAAPGSDHLWSQISSSHSKLTPNLIPLCTTGPRCSCKPKSSILPTLAF